MEELKEKQSHLTFSLPLSLASPVTLIVGIQGHASVYLQTCFGSSKYQKISTMNVKPEGSHFSVQCGEMFHSISEDRSFIFLKVSQNFPDNLATELASSLFALNLKEVVVFDTVLAAQAYFESGSLFTIKTAAFAQQLIQWSSPLPPSIMKQGVVAALLIQGELKQKTVLNISLKVQNRAMIEFFELQALAEGIVKFGGSEWALGDVKLLSLKNKECRELLDAHNSRGSGIYT